MAEIQLFPKFMSVLETCRFPEAAFKTENAVPQATWKGLIWAVSAFKGMKLSNVLYNMAEIRTYTKCYALLDACKFGIVATKTEGAVPQISQIYGFQPSRSSNFKINSWYGLELVRNSIPVLDTCKFEKLAIQTEGALSRTMANMGSFSTEGQVTLRQIIQYGRNSNLSEILCMSWKPASLKKLQSKLNVLRQGQHFPHFKSIAPFCCHILYISEITKQKKNTR